MLYYTNNISSRKRRINAKQKDPSGVYLRVNYSDAVVPKRMRTNGVCKYVHTGEYGVHVRFNRRRTSRTIYYSKSEFFLCRKPFQIGTTARRFID